MPGVEYHANVVRAVQEKDFLHPLPAWAGMLFIFIVAGGTTWLVFRVRRLWWLLSTLVAVVVGILLTSFVVFSFNVIMPILYMLIAFALASGIAVTYQYVNESRQKQFIRRTFQYYLAPDAVRDLLENPHKLQLGGERRELTVLFSDIRGFTSLSERLDPQEITNLLNHHLTAMTNTIMERKGVVDKYIGDAIMAFWGAPREDPEHAINACRAAVAMEQALTKLNAQMRDSGYDELAIGIGINTGEMTVGNMGSEKRFDYTVMGDEVNFASRLEGITKMYGVTCLISDTTYHNAQNAQDLSFRALDKVAVKGKEQPRRIYELITYELNDQCARAFDTFQKGVEMYEKGEWGTAIEYFDKVLQIIPNDGPSIVLRDRAQTLQSDPPEKWNGVYTFSEK
jgi:adenylate cyclase